MLPAYDQCIKASHIFNLLQARGVISVTERQGYILRIRDLARACGEAFLQTRDGGFTPQPHEPAPAPAAGGQNSRHSGRQRHKDSQTASKK